MKLYFSHASPYARKCTMLAKAAKLDNIELILESPANQENYRQLNPLGKIPFLVDEKEVFIDSTLICEYLNDTYVLPKGHCYYLKNNKDYFAIQKQHVFANGIMDAAVNIMLEGRREETGKSDFFLNRWHKAIESTLGQLHPAYLGSVTAPNIATFATIAALEYLDFRADYMSWRDKHPGLNEWHQAFSDTDWVIDTKPKV